MTLKPAYGRDYKSKKAVIEDYEAGKDFIFAGTGQYCSCRDFVGKQVTLRYFGLRRATVHTYKG